MPTSRRRTASTNASPNNQHQHQHQHQHQQEIEHKVHGTIFGIDRNVFYAASFTEEDDDDCDEHVDFSSCSMSPRNAPRRAPLQLAHANNVNSDVDLLGIRQMSAGDNGVHYTTEDARSISSTTTHRGSVHGSSSNNTYCSEFDMIHNNKNNSNSNSSTSRPSSSTSTMNELDIFTVPSVSSGSMKNVVEVEPSYISTKFLLSMRNNNNNNNSNNNNHDGADLLWNGDGSGMRRRRYIQLWLCLFGALVTLFVCIALAASSYSTGSNQQQLQQQLQHYGMVTGIQTPTSTNNDNNYTQHRTLHNNNLEQQFTEWAQRHRRRYSSEGERKKRFQIWSDNHARTMAKNLKHGPCKLLKRDVFGDTHFKDLSPEEFQQRFLTGYKGPKSTALMDPKLSTKNSGGTRASAARHHHNKMTHEYMNQYNHPLHVPRHASLQKAYRDHWIKHTTSSTSTTSQSSSSSSSWFMSITSALFSAIFEADVAYTNGNTAESSSASSYPTSCTWWNLGCFIRWIFGTTFLGAGTREPKYDANSYPSAIDWRTMGAVTSIHSQGDCGACWAITAVETIESAYYIKTGNLMDLAETEVIACDDSCQQCDGGWPQNAYDYVQEHKGLPLESDMSYDGAWLLELTAFLQGESDAYSQNDVDAYLANTCPANSNNNGNSGSGSADNGNNNDNGNVSRVRYGAIKGYGYATERCYCYTDGSGCDCDNQKENQAVRNVASYGPATVCVDASLWQDYTGGIITSESGCSMGFMDMNHCVQAVGYAYVSGNGGEDEGGSGNSKSGSGSGSQDEEQRQGYWIIRNQWDTNWGMNGYAWVAMGENTCGVLNDMTQAFMD
uniref:Peptidase C1A papain C-terminal domain-containing protein n=1 Tax=Leptocylindrus danicus TaxID=163516 RepID=A0A7S2PPS9_9STRA|mmetsp:Transcript_7165/g.10703  ORF Transcript_7165/g.10703 Transcript_7165/m.10703 type:complete len:836 (+) Transcript_7165:47-2554(+)